MKNDGLVTAGTVERIRRLVKELPDVKAYRRQFPPGWDQGSDVFVLRVKLSSGSIVDVQTEAEGLAVWRRLGALLSEKISREA